MAHPSYDAWRFCTVINEPVTSNEAAVKLLSELISIPSMARGVEDGTGDQAVADAVEKFGRACGAEVERQPVGGGDSNVLVSVPADADAPTLVFEAHMDTVALGPMTNGLEPWVDPEDRLHGRGACDTKGSLAMQLLALQWAVRQPRAPCRLVVCAAVGEESSGLGARALAASNADRTIDGAIVGEPTSLEVVRAHRWGVVWDVFTRGTAAHTSHPHLGDNAITRMTQLIEVIHQEYPRLLASKVHPLIGPSTYSIRSIQGGLTGSPNMVPDSCTLHMERRCNPDERPEDVEADFNEILDIARQRHPGLRVESEFPQRDWFGLDTPESSAVVQSLRRGCDTVLGSATVTGAPYGSDAVSLSQVGIPSVLFGPGDIRHAHSPDEFVPVAEVVTGAQILAETWMHFADDE